MKYVIDLREHDDVNGICIGKTYRLTTVDSNNIVVKDLDIKDYYTRGCGNEDVNNTFDVWVKEFDTEDEAKEYYSNLGGYSEVHNPVWDTIDNVFKPKHGK